MHIKMLGLRIATAALTSCLLISAFASVAAAATPTVATDWFFGSAVTGSQGTPVQVDPSDVTVRADGAIGIGYTYKAVGRASGQVPGSFMYEEHGYLYFKNPSDPTSMVGSRFLSGVFTLNPSAGGSPVRIADTAPDAYTSGLRTVTDIYAQQARKAGGSLLGTNGPLTYGYFTFTNAYGTTTGYATPDFTRFVIPITFDVS